MRFLFFRGFLGGKAAEVSGGIPLLVGGVARVIGRADDDEGPAIDQEN